MTSSTTAATVMVVMSVVMGMFPLACLLHTFVVLTDLLSQFGQLFLHIFFALERWKGKVYYEIL